MDPVDSTDEADSADTTEPDPEQPTGEGTLPTAAEQACFEAGIKFGSLYHQFAGTPVSPASAASLADAIEESIQNQPHCEQVTVEMDTEALSAEIAGDSASYTELTGRFMEVQIHIECEGCTVVAEMTMENGYPLMSVASVDRGGS
jgi:Uncharacterized protein conserved in archaea